MININEAVVVAGPQPPILGATTTASVKPCFTRRLAHVDFVIEVKVDPFPLWRFRRWFAGIVTYPDSPISSSRALLRELSARFHVQEVMDHGTAEQETEEDEDTRLMCEVRDGSVEAFSTIYHLHRRRVEHFLYCLFWHREKAEDGAQEVFVRLWSARNRYRACARFTTFLYRIARNYWRDEVRKTQVRPAEVELPVEDSPSTTSGVLLAPVSTEPQHYLFVRYQQWRIQEAIAQLPEAYRIVFVLAHLEQHKIAEIAAILEIPEGTVKSRMHSATRLLRGWLAQESFL